MIYSKVIVVICLSRLLVDTLVKFLKRNLQTNDLHLTSSSTKKLSNWIANVIELNAFHFILSSIFLLFFQSTSNRQKYFKAFQTATKSSYATFHMCMKIGKFVSFLFLSEQKWKTSYNAQLFVFGLFFPEILFHFILFQFFVSYKIQMHILFLFFNIQLDVQNWKIAKRYDKMNIQTKYNPKIWKYACLHELRGTVHTLDDNNRKSQNYIWKTKMVA